LVEALAVAFVWFTVYPTKTKRFVYGFWVINTFGVAFLTVDDKPNVFLGIVMTFKPISPGICGWGIKSFNLASNFLKGCCFFAWY
jgi:hypothetical protein